MKTNAPLFMENSWLQITPRSFMLQFSWAMRYKGSSLRASSPIAELLQVLSSNDWQNEHFYGCSL